MLRSCLVLLAAYAGLFYVYASWLSQQFDSPERYIGAGIMALVTGGSLGALYNGWVAYREWSLIAAARHGLPWSDGRWTAVAGELHPLGEPVVTPFTGEPCALCEYEISLPNTQPKSSNQQHQTGADFAGFLMNPCVVRSAFGDMRLLGFPNLVKVGWRNCHYPAVADNARAFLLGTEFDNLSGIKLVSVFSAIKSAWTDDDGIVQKHLRLTKKTPQEILPELEHAQAGSTPPAVSPEGTVEQNVPEDDFDDDDLDGDDDLAEDDDDFEDTIDYESMDDDPDLAPTSWILFKEKRVKIGDKVCAFGIYSGDKRGLVPGGLGADRFIKLVRGTATTIEQEARNSFFRCILGGFLGLIVVHAAGYGVLLAAAANK
jgi:hypothetical protein